MAVLDSIGSCRGALHNPDIHLIMIADYSSQMGNLKLESGLQKIEGFVSQPTFYPMVGNGDWNEELTRGNNRSSYNQELTFNIQPDGRDVRYYLNQLNNGKYLAIIKDGNNNGWLLGESGGLRQIKMNRGSDGGIAIGLAGKQIVPAKLLNECIWHNINNLWTWDEFGTFEGVSSPEWTGETGVTFSIINGTDVGSCDADYMQVDCDAAELTGTIATTDNSITMESGETYVIEYWMRVYTETDVFQFPTTSTISIIPTDSANISVTANNAPVASEAGTAWRKYTTEFIWNGMGSATTTFELNCDVSQTLGNSSTKLCDIDQIRVVRKDLLINNRP